MSYTVEQEAVLKAASPVTFEGAVALGVELGVSTKSVISKVQHLGLVYVKKVVPAKRPTPVTKAELVTMIEANFGTTFKGLEGATLAALAALNEASN